MRKAILNPIAMFVIGLLLGVISRLLDIYTQNLGEIFSQMAIWILLGTLISIYSNTKKQGDDKHTALLPWYADHILCSCRIDKGRL